MAIFVDETPSEQPDSNGRPLAPHARMLANCTMPRKFLQKYQKSLKFEVLSLKFFYFCKKNYLTPY